MSNEQFNLTSELIEQIVFAMENQKNHFFLDPVVPALVLEKSREQLKEKYYVLPRWEPSDGYRLMEQFVSTLRNPIYRELLASILHSGSNVFRKYKNALNQRPDIERLWFNFKEKEMKRVVLEWYGILRLEWGLETMDLDFTGEPSPVLTDFSIIEEDGSHLDLLRAFDLEAFKEVYSSCPNDYIQDLFRRYRDGFEMDVSSESSIYCAESAAGEIVGFVWLTSEILEGGTTLGRIRQIYVKPEYRGLKLAEKLKDTAILDEIVSSSDILEVEVPEKANYIKKNMKQLGFEESRSMLIIKKGNEITQ